MSENNITPAVKVTDDLPNEISAEEFQRRLFAWFEDRGLLADLRAHLRVQMIGMLKDTALGRTVSGQLKQAISPKLQAINLLIAEFLLRQDYHYSLSVFSTEVPLINVLPEFSNSFISTTIRNAHKKWRFIPKDMWDILDTLGISKESEEGVAISSLYYDDTNEEPLLTCIVRMMHSVISNSQHKPSTSVLICKAPEESCSKLSEKKNKLCDIIELLRNNNVNTNVIQHVVDVFEIILSSEQQRLCQEQREKYLRLEARLNEEAARNEQKLKDRMVAIENTFENERQRIHEENKQKQIRLNKITTSLENQKMNLADQVQQLLHREQQITERENNLSQRQQEVERREHELQTEFDALYAEHVALEHERQNVRRQIWNNSMNESEKQNFVQKKLQNECAEKVDKEQQTSNKENEEHIQRGILSQLQSENSNLRKLNTEQRNRIQELSERISALCRELEDTQNRPVIFRSYQPSAVGILTAPPLTAPPASSTPHPRQRGGLASYNGSGEEAFRAIPSTLPRQYRNLYSSRESRKRTQLPRRNKHYSSSEENTTDEILREARSRLRILEQESEEIDRKFQSFQSKQEKQASKPDTITYIYEGPSTSINHRQNQSSREEYDSENSGDIQTPNVSRESSSEREDIERKPPKKD